MFLYGFVVLVACVVVFLSLSGVEKSGFVPYFDRKNAKNGGFLRVCGDFWCVFGVKMVYSCVKIKKTRFILLAALTADIVGIITSVVVCRFLS